MNNNIEEGENGDDEDDTNDVETIAAESEDNEPVAQPEYSKMNGHLRNMNDTDLNEAEQVRTIYIMFRSTTQSIECFF